MRLVHRLLCVEDDYAEAQTTLNVGDVGIGPDGKMEAAVLLELVAQTYAASQGYQDRLAGKLTNIGYLVGAQNFHIEDLPAAGQQLLIKIQIVLLFRGFLLCGRTGAVRRGRRGRRNAQGLGAARCATGCQVKRPRDRRTVAMTCITLR